MVLATIQLPDGYILDYTEEDDWVAQPGQDADAQSTANLLNILFSDWVGYKVSMGDPVWWQVERVAGFTNAHVLSIREAEAEVMAPPDGQGTNP